MRRKKEGLNLMIINPIVTLLFFESYELILFHFAGFGYWGTMELPMMLSSNA